MEQQVVFEVQGSAPDPYRVIFVRRNLNNLSAYCSCPAGVVGQYCKHRFAILEGSAGGIVSPNVDEVNLVRSWIPGSDVEKALLKVRDLEKEASRIKNELSNAKKAVAKAMRD